jgi:nucleotidyltransferase substrate binding protein (TIGR01987 family)
MEKSDIRWIQRFENYIKAFSQLEEAILLANKRPLSNLEEQGLIQAFEYTHELAWKTLKDFLNYQGNQEIYGSKDATRQAFKYELIENGEIWMDMIKSRNNSSHTYNESIAEEILNSIISNYYSEF